MENKPQKCNQNGNQTEGSFSKPQQKLYSAFANILMKYQTNKSQNDLQPSRPDKKQHQSNSSAIDNNYREEGTDRGTTVSHDEEKEIQSDVYKNRKLTVASDNEAQAVLYQEPEMKEKKKRLIKKAGKKLSPQDNNMLNKNYYGDIPAQFFNKKSQKICEAVQIIESDEQQKQNKEQEVIVEQKRSKKDNSKTKQLPQLLRITPQIQICPDKQIKRLLQNSNHKNYPTQATNNQMSSINFTIDITLLPNSEITINSNNKAISNFMASKSSNFVTGAKEFNKLDQKRRSKQLMEEFSHESPTRQENKRLEMNEFYQQEQQSSSQLQDYHKIRQMNQNNKKLNIQPFQNTFRQNKLQQNQKNGFFESKKSKLQMPKQTARIDLEDQRQPKNYLDPFKKRNEPMNASSATLKDLVKQLFKRKIINETLYNQFVENHCMQDIKNFLSKFNSGKLHHFDYSKIKFTLLDHRRIAELLVNLFSDDYFIGGCSHQDPEVLQFLRSLFQLEAEDYFNLYTRIDKISGIKWWSKILLANDQRLMEVNKERRIAIRRAEQASLAVKQIVQNAKRKSAVSESNIQMSQVGDNNQAQRSRPPQRTFFGHSQQTKANIRRKRQQQRQLMQIRDIVANKFTGKSQNSQENSKKLVMRKKIKFY